MKKRIQTVLVKIQQDAGLEFPSQRNRVAMSDLVTGQAVYNLLNLRTVQGKVNKAVKTKAIENRYDILYVRHYNPLLIRNRS